MEFAGDYTGWQYREDSPEGADGGGVPGTVRKEPKIEAIHAGLECGVFA